MAKHVASALYRTRAAEQFAADSGSRVGAIRKSQQGYFSIEDRDPFSPEHIGKLALRPKKAQGGGAV